MSTSSKTLDAAKHIRQKPAYSLGQNIAFMISLAWKQRCSVILYALTMIAVAIMLSLTQLFIVPTILGRVETNASVAELTTMILLFTGALIIPESVKLKRYEP